MSRIRLLPLVIFCAGLTLTVKLGALWQDMEVVMFAPAVAESKKEPEAVAKDKAKAQSETGKETKDGAKEIAKADTGKDGKGAAKDGKSAGATDTGAVKEDSGEKRFDPALATDAEVEVLQRLALRRQELNKRSREIDLRETMLVATERRVKVKIAELKKYQSIVEGLLKKHDREQESKYRSLVKIYESMKPKDAARIFEQLEMPVLLNVVERMREARTGPILAKMAPAKAKVLTTALADRRILPKLVKK